MNRHKKNKIKKKRRESVLLPLATNPVAPVTRMFLPLKNSTIPIPFGNLFVDIDGNIIELSVPLFEVSFESTLGLTFLSW